MKIEFFIARRFSAEREGGGMSRPAVRIAVTGIALGLAVMLVAMAVIVGFKTEVSRQIVGFGSHIQVLPQYAGTEGEGQYITLSEETRGVIEGIENVVAVQRVVARPGIVHTAEAMQGVVLKGVDSTYRWEFFEDNMVRGRTLDRDTMGNGALISRVVADAMRLDTGDRFDVYFVDRRLRARRFTVAGIYNTTFADYDRLYIITGLGVMQRLNGWADGQYSSAELLVGDIDRSEETVGRVYAALAEGEVDGAGYRVETIQSLTPQIFDWLDMLDMNAVVVLVLMVAVSGFCVISGLLILILERSGTIGLFKALGATDGMIRRVFVAQGSILVSRGMLWGNVMGLGLIAVQYATHVIPLDAASYYVDYVPVYLSAGAWVAVNVGLGVAAMVMLVAPSYLVTRIAPAEAMRRE